MSQIDKFRRCIMEKASFNYQIIIATYMPLLKESRCLMYSTMGKLSMQKPE